MKLSALNAAAPDVFVDALKDIFEHSPWVAEAACASRPHASREALHAAMEAAVEAAGAAAQLALIRAHPDLAGKAARAGALTAHSRNEQSGAGLDSLSEAEFARFHALNRAYRDRFGFPFIIAVKGLAKDDVLAAFEARLANDADAERREALRNVSAIGRFRLFDLVEG